MKRRARRSQFREGVRRVQQIARLAHIEKYQEQHGARMVKVAFNGIEFHERLKAFASDELITKLMLIA